MKIIENFFKEYKVVENKLSKDNSVLFKYNFKNVSYIENLSQNKYSKKHIITHIKDTDSSYLISTFINNNKVYGYYITEEPIKEFFKQEI